MMFLNCSEKAAYILTLAGLLPKEASAQEIALAEKLAKEFRFLRDAAYELRVILNAHTKF